MLHVSVVYAPFFLEQSGIVIQKRIISFGKIYIYIYIIQFYLGSKSAGEMNTYFVHCDLSDGFMFWNIAILQNYKLYNTHFTYFRLNIFIWL